MPTIPTSVPSAPPQGISATPTPDTAIGAAIAAYQRGEWSEAEKLCRAILDADADAFDALRLLATIAVQTKRAHEANELLARAASINPGNPEVHNTRGVALRELERYDEALDSYDRAIALAPHYAEAHANRGVALRNLGRYEEALQSYDRALALKPDFAEVLNNRGIALSELERYPEAMQSYLRANQVRPGYDFVYGSWLHAKMHICDWADMATHCARLLERVERLEKAASPFQILAIPSSAALQKKAAEIVVRYKYPASDALPELSKSPARDRIRVGYFSADLHEHATSYLMAQLFERHDKSKFHLTAFSYGPASTGALRERITAAFDDFVDVRSRSDEEVARLARTMGIDIAVDLKGFTQNGRPGIFALRAAPIQVSYLGYPGTLGADYIDYLIADATLIPAADQQHYTEKIVYLPNSYQVNDTRRPIADRLFHRDELGLPSHGFVFACFNGAFKIMPDAFDGWMRILARVEGSVLWLLRENQWAVANLQKEAERRGIDPQRLIFAPRMPLDEHLARHRCADLFLDTLPCNAHTTASDALWAGLPVLTRLGETFAGRVAASLLGALDLAELIATTPVRYEDLAVELAVNPERLDSIKQKLADNRNSGPLFDVALFTNHLEAAYRAMYQRYQAGAAPEHLYVSD